MASVPTNPTDLLLDEDIPPGMPTTGPDLDLQLKIWAGVQILWPFLRNPADSPICAASVHKMLRRLLLNPGEDMTKSSVRILRMQHQQALDAMVYFVAIPRPPASLEALEATLNKCNCDLTAPVLEMIHENDNFAPWTFKDLISSIFLVLGAVVENLKVGHIPGSHSAAVRGKPKDGKWPSSTAAIFPRGTDEAIVSFTWLYRLTRAPSILDFIRHALQHCPSLAAPAVNSPAFWEALVEELQRAVDKIDTDPRIIEIEMAQEHEDEDAPPPIRSVRAIAQLIRTLIFTFTESLRKDIQSSALIPCARNIYDLLLRFLIRTKSSPSSSKSVDFCLMVAGIASSLATALPKNHPTRPPTLHPVIVSYARLDKGGPFTTVYSVIAHLTKTVAECCNATCAATSESSIQKLRYCAQCQVMRYCSSTCQKTAWKYHKLVYKDLEKLKKEVLPRCSRSEKGPFQIFFRDFETEAKKHGFTNERMRELSAELVPFLHYENVGMKSAPSHEKANHY